MPNCNQCNFIIGSNTNPSPCVARNAQVDPWGDSCDKFTPFEESTFDFDYCGKIWAEGRMPRQKNISEENKENCKGCPLLNKGCK